MKNLIFSFILLCSSVSIMADENSDFLFYSIGQSSAFETLLLSLNEFDPNWTTQISQFLEILNSDITYQEKLSNYNFCLFKSASNIKNENLAPEILVQYLAIECEATYFELQNYLSELMIKLNNLNQE